MRASCKAWLLYIPLAVIGSISSYFYIEHVRENMWSNIRYQIEQDLDYPILVVNKPYNKSTQEWSLWCAEFILNGPKKSCLAYYEFTPNLNSNANVDEIIQIDKIGTSSSSKQKYYWMLGGESFTERVNNKKQHPWLYLESLKTQDLIDILKVHNRYYFFPEYESIFPYNGYTRIRNSAWFSPGLYYKGIDLRVVWCRQCTLSNQYYIDIMLLTITILLVLALIVFLIFGNKIRQENETRKLEQDTKDNPLWYELKELLNPARFIADYDSEKVSLANSLYNELLKTQKNDLKSLTAIHRKAIGTLNIPSISIERLTQLKDICNPARYLDPYDAEKVELANSLYSRLQNNDLTIDEIAEIEEKSKTL
jgi:hypothetical protein